MKKRFLSVLLSMTVVTALAVGCSSGPDNTADNTQENTADEQKEDKAAADDETGDTADVEPVEQRTVYVTPKWVKSVIDGNQAGYEDAVVAEVTYTGALDDSESYKKGHIPGAILVGDTEVEDAEGTVMKN